MICSTDSAKILAAVEDVPPAANPTTSVIWPSFGSAGLESVKRGKKLRRESRHVADPCSAHITCGTEIDWITLFNCELLKETHSDWLGTSSLSGTAVRILL